MAKSNIANLIIVAGHAAFRDTVKLVPVNPQLDEYWVLQNFQSGEPPYYMEHIYKGVELLKSSPDSLLMFSGGYTRREAGHWSEASTYAAIAQSIYKVEGNHIALEEYACDSYENIEFSLFRFYEIMGFYPRHITVVGWGFKERRFDFHRQTLNIPNNSFTYVGYNNPIDLDGAMKWEEKTLELFMADPRGNNPPLSDKRQKRNPFNKVPPYSSCPPLNFN